MMAITITKTGISLNAFSAHDDAASKRPAKKCASAIPACIPYISESSGLRRIACAKRSIASSGANRPGAKVSQGTLDQFWLWSMQAGLKNAFESIKALSETDFTEDLKKFDVPTLVLHGEDDQIVPVKDSAVKSARLIKGAKDIYYPGAPHGITATHQDQINADLLAFIKA